MRTLTLCLTLLFIFSGGVTKLSATTATRLPSDRVVISKRRVVIVRRGRLARQFPERRRAIISYPFITGGLDNPVVLNKVRSLLQVKNIFDMSVEQYRADAWLDEFDYTVNYNKNYILDLAFTQSGMAAYPDSQTRNFVINLKTGAIVKARDVFKPSTLTTLAAMVDRKLQDEIKQFFADADRRGEIAADERKNIQEMFAALNFEPKNLDDFSVSDKGITFLYDAGFPHVARALQPDGRYFFSYVELRPYIRTEGLLGRFI
ncbi:MAG TPA: hypothetical protein VF723_02650 [Pyrinomonadaceae bacterium]